MDYRVLAHALDLVPAQPKVTGTPLPLTWVQPAGIVGLSLSNFLLRILTFGIYQFWGKTEVRRRVWSGIRLAGEPLQYTGTGGELFVGFLIVLAVIVLPTTLAFFAGALVFGPQSSTLVIMQVVSYIVFFMLYGIGIYRAQRYRLSRTRWRGIRGGVEGSQWRYTWTYFWTALLIPVTLGWIVPWRANTLQRLLTNDMRFGSLPFRYDGGSAPLYKRYLVVWLGAILIFGTASYVAAAYVPRTGQPPSIKAAIVVVSILATAYIVFSVVAAWYRAGMINHFARSTKYQTLTFRAELSAPGLVWLTLVNYLIIIAGALLVGAIVMAIVAGIIQALGLESRLQMPLQSFLLQMTPLAILLGMGAMVPMIQVRTARYVVEHMAIEGTIDAAGIAQGAGSGPNYGEGIAQAFNVDAF